jgi:hypothetical protein
MTPLPIEGSKEGGGVRCYGWDPRGATVLPSKEEAVSPPSGAKR